VPPGSRLTARLRREVGEAAADRFSCVLAAASHYRVSWPIAQAALAAHVAGPLAEPLPAVDVLGIDETRRGKPVWARDPVTGRWRIVADRWHTGIVDAVGTSGLLAHVEGRTSAAVIAWLAEQPQPWRDAVTHVCIDLSASYAKAVRVGLPQAVIVADRFHLVRLANDMLTEVRQRVTREHYGRRGRAVDPAWSSRRRLLTGFDKLSPTAFERMWNGLIDTGDPGIEILHAYTVKEDLRALLALSGTSPTRAAIAHRLERFYRRAASCPAPEAHRLAQTIEAWWPAVEAAITTGYSNARSEGYNRLAKHVGRDAFGFRNVDNQRQRIRWACTRQHRRESAVTTRLPG
jgi:transposase